MKSAFKLALILSALSVIAILLDGCGGVAASGYVGTPVYGDYGYVGPWDDGPVVVEGGYYSRPPHDAWVRDHQADEHRRVETGPAHNQPRPAAAPGVAHAAPSPHSAARPIPSIPNRPRPAPQGKDRDRNRK